MRIVCLNCNGYRSASSKGLKEYLEKLNPDIICFQEIKAEPIHLESEYWASKNYTMNIFSSRKKGYSGTAIISRQKPITTEIGLGQDLYDSEGRCILHEYKNFTLVNTYFPSGTSGEERQKVKYDFLDYFMEKSKSWKKKYKNIILCGDYNIAHTENDIHDPKGNVKNSGFLPEEREWLSQFINSGFTDTYRKLNPESRDYSWWSFRSNARKQNKGWRIDYFFAYGSIIESIRSSSIDKTTVLSDHAPLILDLDL